MRRKAGRGTMLKLNKMKNFAFKLVFLFHAADEILLERESMRGLRAHFLKKKLCWREREGTYARKHHKAFTWPCLSGHRPRACFDYFRDF